MTNKSPAASRLHASSARRIATSDRALARLIEFANLPTPFVERRSTLSSLNDIRRAMASVAANPALLERAPYPDGGLPRMPAALLALWIRARDAFPHPTVAAAVQVLIGPTDQFSPAAVCMDVEHLVATLWIVRAALWRIALAQAHHDPRPFAIGVPSADMVASRDRISVGANGRITIEHRDISAALLAILGELNLERLRICRARYRRTRSTCSRLFLALRKDQKDCSRQCADLRRHNDVRHPSAKPECVKCGRVWSADRLWVCNFSDCPNGGN